MSHAGGGERARSGDRLRPRATSWVGPGVTSSSLALTEHQCEGGPGYYASPEERESQSYGKSQWEVVLSGGNALRVVFGSINARTGHRVFLSRPRQRRSRAFRRVSPRSLRCVSLRTGRPSIRRLLVESVKVQLATRLASSTSFHVRDLGERRFEFRREGRGQLAQGEVFGFQDRIAGWGRSRRFPIPVESQPQAPKHLIAYQLPPDDGSYGTYTNSLRLSIAWQKSASERWVRNACARDCSRGVAERPKERR